MERRDREIDGAPEGPEDGHEARGAEHAPHEDAGGLVELEGGDQGPCDHQGQAQGEGRCNPIEEGVVPLRLRPGEDASQEEPGRKNQQASPEGCHTGEEEKSGPLPPEQLFRARPQEGVGEMVTHPSIGERRIPEVDVGYGGFGKDPHRL